MEEHHTGSAPAPTWGRVGVPAGPEAGWDIPGASRTFTEEKLELGQERGCDLGVSALSIQALSWMGQNGPGHDPSRTQRDKEPPGSCGVGQWEPLGQPSLPRDAPSMWDVALWSTDVLKVIPPRPGRDQEAALELGLGFTWLLLGKSSILLGISFFLLGIYILYTFIMRIYTSYPHVCLKTPERKGKG